MPVKPSQVKSRRDNQPVFQVPGSRVAVLALDLYLESLTSYDGDNVMCYWSTLVGFERTEVTD